jgi:hypothetical protein
MLALVSAFFAASAASLAAFINSVARADNFGIFTEQV